MLKKPGPWSGAGLTIRSANAFLIIISIFFTDISIVIVDDPGPGFFPFWYCISYLRTPESPHMLAGKCSAAEDHNNPMPSDI